MEVPEIPHCGRGVRMHRTSTPTRPGTRLASHGRSTRTGEPTLVHLQAWRQAPSNTRRFRPSLLVGCREQCAAAAEEHRQVGLDVARVRGLAQCHALAPARSSVGAPAGYELPGRI